MTFPGKRGVWIAVAPELARRPDYIAGQIEPETFAQIEGLEFTDGVIEAEVAGAPVRDKMCSAASLAGREHRKYGNPGFRR